MYVYFCKCESKDSASGCVTLSRKRVILDEVYKSLSADTSTPSKALDSPGPPRHIKEGRSGESPNMTILLHRYSSLGSLTFSHPFPSFPFLFSALPPSFLLACLPIRRPSFHILPTPKPLRSSPPRSHHLYLTTFTLATALSSLTERVSVLSSGDGGRVCRGERDSPTLIFRLCTPSPLPLPPALPEMSHRSDGTGTMGVISGPGLLGLIIRQLAISLQALHIV
ncbi:hypothetical protein Q8A73_018675 [Channa argus]|nr:hypothetical protein Q8A73_018675 [Channa argus]